MRADRIALLEALEIPDAKALDRLLPPDTLPRQKFLLRLANHERPQWWRDMALARLDHCGRHGHPEYVALENLGLPIVSWSHCPEIHHQLPPQEECEETAAALRGAGFLMNDVEATGPCLP